MSCCSVTQADTPSVDTIINRVVAKFEEEGKALQSMQFNQTALTDELDDSGKVIRHRETHLIIRPGAKQEVQVVSFKDDGLSENDAREKAKDLEKTETGKRDFNLRNLVQHFNITWQGQEQISGRNAYILAFEPKPNQSYNTQAEKLLNYFHGRIWINPADYTILQTKASLTEPVNVAWFFAAIQMLNFDYQRTELTPGAYGPDHIQIEGRASAPFTTLHLKQNILIDGFTNRTISTN